MRASPHYRYQERCINIILSSPCLLLRRGEVLQRWIFHSNEPHVDICLTLRSTGQYWANTVGRKNLCSELSELLSPSNTTNLRGDWHIEWSCLIPKPATGIYKLVHSHIPERKKSQCGFENNQQGFVLPSFLLFSSQNYSVFKGARKQVSLRLKSYELELSRLNFCDWNFLSLDTV